jgi:hypothetical protein
MCNKNQIIIFLIAFSLIVRHFSNYYPFFGLEYEDSYIFSSVSKAININYDFSYDTLFTKYPTLGSLEEPIRTGTISGHFIFFPLLLSIINLLFGFSPTNILVVNSILSVFQIYITIKTFEIFIKSNQILLCFGLVYSTIPFLVIQNSSGLSETFSSIFVSLAVYFALKSIEKTHSKRKTLILYILFVMISIFIKRDNLILILIPISDLFYELFLKKNYKIPFKELSILSLIVFFLILLSLFIDIKRTLNDEMNDIGQNPIMFEYFKQIFPIFLTSLTEFSFFSVTGVLFFLGILCLNSYDKNSLILLILSLMYMVMYSIHYRSYYMIHGNFIPKTFDTFRYFTNFYSVIFLFGAIQITRVRLGSIKIMNNTRVLIFAILTLIGFNLYSLLEHKSNFSEEEKVIRITPVKRILSLINENDVIVTDLPVIFQIYGKPNLYTVDITQMTNFEFKQLDYLSKTKSIWIMLNKNIDPRYPSIGTFLKKYNLKFSNKINDDYSLFRVTVK